MLTQSAPMGNGRHHALMQVSDVTFYGFEVTSSSADSDFFALEACSKCKA